MRNVSVVIEGVDGSGKTELCTRLVRDLGARSFKFPDRSTNVGKLIDAHLVGKWTACPADGSALRGGFGEEHALLNAELHQALQAANRLERAADLSAAMADVNVVIDRYSPSGEVYGYMDGLQNNWIDAGMVLPRPDIFILLDVDPETAMSRVLARSGSSDDYERRGAEWFGKACAAYRQIWRMRAGVALHAKPGQLVTEWWLTTEWWSFDANRPADTVHAEVAARIDAWRRKENNIHE